MSYATRLRKVGGSLVATIPKEATEKLNLSDNDVVELEIRKPRKSFFGVYKGIPSFKESDRLDER